MSFVDEGPTIRELYRTDEKGKGLADRSSSATSLRSRPVSSAPFEHSNHGLSEQSGTTAAPKDKRRFQDHEISTLASISSPAAYQSQLLSHFFGTILSGNPARIATTFSGHSVWLAQLASRTEVSSTLLHAIRAISLSFLGRQTRDENLIQNARLIYGKTLLKLNKSLRDPIEGYASDTLSATVLLTFFEMVNCTEQHSWVRHAGGAAHLMQLRGAHRHRTDFDKAIFLACRLSLVIESYYTGKPCFLSAAPWRELSREIHNSSPNKSAFDDAREAFFQEVVHHPGYVVDAVDYLTRGGRDQSVLQNLVRRGHMHRSNHRAIFIRSTEALREAGQEPKEVPSYVGDKVFPVVYQFPSTLVASFLCSYWTFLKLLNISLVGLEAKLSAMESACQGSGEESTPAQILAVRDIRLSRENMRNAVVAESATPSEFVSPAFTSGNKVIVSGGARRMIQDPTLSSPVRDRAVGIRSPASLMPMAHSPTDYPTMSSNDTAKRRQMYMTENRYGAQQICKSVEDVSTSVFFGPVFLIFALRVMGRMLGSREEKEWVVRKLENLGRTWGVAKEELDVAQMQTASQGFYERAFGISPGENGDVG